MNPTNGKQQPPTADTIRSNGLDVAQDIRALAAQAKAEGEALAAMAEDVAGAVVEASEGVANRVTSYLAKCAEARTSLQQHQKELRLTEAPASPKSNLPVNTQALETTIRK